jgi:hypothetical protein
MKLTLGHRPALDTLHSHGSNLGGNHQLPPYNILHD